MGKKAKNNSRRLKTSHKKALIKRKVVNCRVDPQMANVNKFISQTIAHPTDTQEHPKLELESITFDELRKLIDKPSDKKRYAKLTVEDESYLEGLLKKWGNNYERMAKDIKLNRMQWTAKQIEKKHEAYKALME